MLKANKIKDFVLLVMTGIVCAAAAWMFLRYAGKKVVHVVLLSYVVTVCIDIITGKKDKATVADNKYLVTLNDISTCSMVILIFTTVAIIMHEPKNGIDTATALAFLLFTGVVHFSSAGLMGYLTGQFHLRNFKAERSEKPLLFNFIIVICSSLSTVCFVGFVRLVLELTGGI